MPIRISRIAAFKGDIHLGEPEKSRMSQVREITGEDTPFRIPGADGKYDFTAKWRAPGRSREVADRFRGRILFVQVVLLPNAPASAGGSALLLTLCVRAFGL